MSLPWKSEVVLRLRRDGCSARVLAPWSRSVLAEADAEGPPPASIVAVLKALRALPLERWPGSARLLVPDELAYLSLRPPSVRHAEAHQEAVAHFARTLGRQDLQVQVAALPESSGWLAAAIEPADLQSWRDTLAAEQLRLDSVQLALVDDLRAVAEEAGERAVVALMRDEGMSLVRLEQGTPTALSWERCDPHSLHCIEQRLLAFQNAVAQAEAPAPVLMLCRDEPQRREWARLSRAHRWTLMLRDAASTPPLGGVPT